MIGDQYYIHHFNSDQKMYEIIPIHQRIPIENHPDTYDYSSAMLVSCVRIIDVGGHHENFIMFPEIYTVSH